ncbi:unnamed protein product, partial [Brenthis ino]
MDQILNKVRTLDPNNSDSIKEALTLFFQKLPKYNDPICNKWLREMRNIIDRFPKYCMSHRINVENYFVGFLSSNNYYSVIEVAKCVNALQQVRPTKEKTATPKSSWRDQMSVLCNAAHALITAIFPNAVDIYKDNATPKTMPAKSPITDFLVDITKVVKNTKDKQLVLQIRLKNIFIFIQAMLVETYPVAKPIQPRSILDVIVRALSVTSGSNQDDNIAAVKIQALRTLDALIMCLGSNLIPFSPLIIRLVMQTLRWSTDNPSEGNRKVRTTAYNTLTGWLTTLHTHRISDNNSWEDELSSHIIYDITPQKKIVQFTMGPQPTKNLSKKAKRKLANTQLQESTISAHMPGEKNKISFSEEVNNEVAMAALECAEAFLTVCGRFLKPATHKLFQEHVIRECFKHACYEEDYVICLLHVLEASRKSTPNSTPAPTQYCLQLYSTLVNMQNSEISKFCSQALLNIRLHLHCSPPSINFAMELPHEVEKPENKRKKVSEKNRAVLESLLGKEKVPSEEIVEEIITIADEPSNKKPRMEDDKISVSSDEVEDSVEISDDSQDNMVIEEVIELVEATKENEPTLQNNESQMHTQNEVNSEKLLTQVEDNKEQTDNLSQDSNADIVLTQTENITEVDIEINKISIHEAQTQFLLNASSGIEDNAFVYSVEVGCDLDTSKLGTENVILEKSNTENLPSTNESDDVQISCGQILQNSQDIDEKKSDTSDKVSETEDVPKTNGNVQEENVQNGDITKDDVDSENVGSKIVKNNISVEDMLADFVDEVNEEVAET